MREGVVSLTRQVPDKWVKQLAGQTALELRNIIDVIYVQNNLRVMRPSGERPQAGSRQR